MSNALDLIKQTLLPHTKRAYFVGGYVRDKLLGIRSSDMDIEVYDIAPDLFENLMRSIGAKGVGKDFFVYKLDNIDISLPRSETKVARGHAGFSVAWCNNPAVASRRRDFTINSIMINVFDNTTVDLNGGQSDLEAKILRHIDDKSFVEDSLRVFRAVQFSARFGFKVAPKTIELCKTMDLSDLNKDRIWGEIEKLLNAKNSLYGIYYLFKLGVFEYLFGKRELDLMLCRWAKRSSNLLFLIRWRYKIPANKIAQAVGTPNRVAKELAKWNLSPMNPTDRFLVATALKGALKDYPPIDALKLQQKAEELSVYQKPYQPKIKPLDLMELGFSGKELGIKLKKEILKEIRKYESR